MTEPRDSGADASPGERIDRERRRLADDGAADGEAGRAARDGDRRPPADGPDLDPRELRKADEEEEINVSVTYEVIRRAGRDELRRPSAALAWSGLAAGLSMGFSMLTQAWISGYLPDADWTTLISKFGYCIGFLAVILGGQQLYTENTLTAVIPLLARRTRDALLNTLRLWGVVLTANLVGALLFALLLTRPWLFEPATTAALDHVAAAAMRGGVLVTFVKAIFAGWLIALMVWMLPAAKQLAVVVIVIMTYVVGIAELPHIVAGGVEAFYAGVSGAVAWGPIVTTFLLPTLLGNTVGGVALVSGLAHAQVVAGRDARDDRRTREGRDARRERSD